jgi:hypothetical protein
MSDNDWRQEETAIAVANDNTGEWEFLLFPSWKEARQAVNAARSISQRFRYLGF